MSADAPADGGALRQLFASANFARAYTITVLAVVLSSFAIERTAGLTTYVTMIAGLCLIAVAILVARRPELSRWRLMPFTLVALLAWMLVSTFWSRDTSTSFWAWVAAAGLTLLAVTIGVVRDALQTARALGDVMRWVLSISLGIEILSGVLLDMPFAFLGIEGRIAELGPVQGIFGTRNMLGFVAVIALITFIIEYRTQSVPPGLSLFSVTLGGLLAALSDSPTVGVLAVAVGGAALALWAVRRAAPARRSAWQWGLGIGVMLGLAVAYLLRLPIIARLGAGTDLWMRTELWSAVLGFVDFRPVQGFGWYGSWTRYDFPFYTINFQLGERHASALNAFVDVLLQLGWVGLLLFAALTGMAVVRSWLVATERRAVVYAWTPLTLVALLVDSIFESFTLTGFGWVLLVVCAVRASQSRSWRDRFGSLTAGDPSGGHAEPPMPREGRT